MTDDNTTNDEVPGGRVPDRQIEQPFEQPWDPEADDTDWWADDPDVAERQDRRRPRKLITVVALLTVAGFAAATVISSGESRSPATTVPRAPIIEPSTTIPSTDAPPSPPADLEAMLGGQG